MKKQWQSKGSKIISRNVSGYDFEEQECHINISRCDSDIQICCNHKLFLTKLKKNPSFIVKEMGVNPNNKVIVVIGTLPKGFVSFRTK